MPTPRLSLTGDLAFEVDGTPGTVRAHGRQIRVDVTDPVAAFRATTGTYGGRPGVAAVAAALTEAGVTVEVHGRLGPLAAAGAGVDSTIGAVLAGSRQVSVGRGVVREMTALIDRRVLAAVVALVVGAEIRRRR